MLYDIYVYHRFQDNEHGDYLLRKRVTTTNYTALQGEMKILRNATADFYSVPREDLTAAAIAVSILDVPKDAEFSDYVATQKLKESSCGTTDELTKVLEDLEKSLIPPKTRLERFKALVSRVGAQTLKLFTRKQ